MTQLVLQKRRPFLFIGLVFLLSTPFYLLGNRQVLLASLHLYAPAFVFASAIPLLLAITFVFLERGPLGLRAMWKNLWDAKRIKDRLWYIPILLLMPVTMAATYALQQFFGHSISNPEFPLLAAPLLFVAFFVFAVGEEAGWSGYVIGGLQERWSALSSGVVLGLAWAGWHVIPFLQAGHASYWWAIWQCAGTVSLRVIMVWIFNNTGKSLFAMVLFHAMINETEFMYPNLGSHYEPLIPFVILTTIAALVVYLWGPATLAGYRFTPAVAASLKDS